MISIETQRKSKLAHYSFCLLEAIRKVTGPVEVVTSVHYRAEWRNVNVAILQILQSFLVYKVRNFAFVIIKCCVFFLLDFLKQTSKMKQAGIIVLNGYGV